MSTNTLKQALEIVYGDIKNINRRVVNLESASAGVLYTETTKSAVAYQDNVSANACPYALLNKVGAMSYKSENLCQTNSYNGVMNNTIAKSIDLGNLAQGTYTISFNVIANNDNRTFILYYVNNGVVDSANNINSGLNGTGAKSFTFTLDNSVAYDDIILGINTGTLSYNIELNSLMLNTGSTELPYQPYFEGIRDSAVSSVVSKDSNNTTLQTMNIPQEIQALTGYGWGINSRIYNYIDFVNKKFIQKVGRVDLSSLTWNTFDSYSMQSDSISTLIKKPSSDSEIANILAENYTERARNTLDNYGDIAINSNGIIFVRNNQEGTPSGELYYELATPIETDISSYIDDNSIQIEANGTITFDNTYQQAIPYEYLYLETVGANNE